MPVMRTVAEMRGMEPTHGKRWGGGASGPRCFPFRPPNRSADKACAEETAMTVIAIILLALVIFAVVAAVTADAGTVSIEVFDRNIDTTVTEVFLAGVLTGLVALAAIVLLRIAVRRS